VDELIRVTACRARSSPTAIILVLPPTLLPLTSTYPPNQQNWTRLLRLTRYLSRSRPALLSRPHHPTVALSVRSPTSLRTATAKGWLRTRSCSFPRPVRTLPCSGEGRLRFRYFLRRLWYTHVPPILPFPFDPSPRNTCDIYQPLKRSARNSGSESLGSRCHTIPITARTPAHAGRRGRGDRYAQFHRQGPCLAPAGNRSSPGVVDGSGQGE